MAEHEKLVELMSAAAHEAWHKGMKNVYVWGDPGLIAEHRDYVEGMEAMMHAALSVIREAGYAEVIVADQKDAKEALAWMQMNMPYRYYVAVRAMLSASPIGEK